MEVGSVPEREAQAEEGEKFALPKRARERSMSWGMGGRKGKEVNCSSDVKKGVRRKGRTCWTSEATSWSASASAKASVYERTCQHKAPSSLSPQSWEDSDSD